MYARAKTPNPVIHPFVREGWSLSKKGSRSHNRPTRPKASTPRTSPAINHPLDGMSLRGWHMNRKYHSGLIAAGADTHGSALTPRFHGKTAANAPSTPTATYQAIISRSMKLGKNFISRLADGFAVHCTSSVGGMLMPRR